MLHVHEFCDFADRCIWCDAKDLGRHHIGYCQHGLPPEFASGSGNHRRAFRLAGWSRVAEGRTLGSCERAIIVAAAAATSTDDDGSRRIRVWGAVMTSKYRDHGRTCHRAGDHNENIHTRNKRVASSAVCTATNRRHAAGLPGAAAARYRRALCVRWSGELANRGRCFNSDIRWRNACHRRRYNQCDGYRKQCPQTTHSAES